MDIRKGKCINFGNDCPIADHKQTVELSVTEDFVCPECGNDLIEDIPPKKLPWVKIIIGIALLCGVGFGAYMFISSPKTEKPEKKETKVAEKQERKTALVPVESISLNKNDLSLEVSKSETLTVSVLPEDATKKDVEWSSSDESVVKIENGKVTAVKSGTVTITVKSVADPSKIAECKVSAGCGSRGVINYSFGRYDGSLANCIPEGSGRMDYKCKIQIAKNGNETIYAESGWFFTGTWSNGDIVSGNLYDRSGNQQKFIRVSRRTTPYDLNEDKCQ